MKTRQEDSAFGFAARLTRDEDIYNHGLTKRELFAAMAMQGMLANGVDRHAAHVNAIYAVQHADALINELNKE